MSKILVIGDTHHSQNIAEAFIKDLNWEGPIVFLGDYFDQFYDTLEDVKEAALWLKESLKNPNRIHLMGNHDFHYRLPLQTGIFCSGFTPEKHELIQSLITEDEWNQIEYFYAKDNCWFSHAGISYKWFSHPVLGPTKEVIEDVIKKAKADIKGRLYDTSNFMALNAADFYRGGRYDKGGLLWCDWRNLDFFPGITQIVGHTPRENVKAHSRKNGLNINVDTHMKECIIIDTDTKDFEIISKTKLTNS